MSETSEPVYAVPPVSRAIALLRHVAAGNRCRNISRASKQLGINRTTLIRLLATLEQEGLIERLADEDGIDGYRLGAGLITLAAAALGQRDMVEISRPYLRRLVEDLGLSAHLGVREGTEIVYLARETPNSHLASTVRVGTRLAAHATTIGRALLAEMPLEDLRALYPEGPLPAFSEKTAVTRAALEAQLAEDRARGVAWSIANFESEIGSAAVPVRDHTGAVAGAINVTGHVSAFETGAPDATRIEARIKEIAREISAALGWNGA